MHGRVSCHADCISFNFVEYQIDGTPGLSRLTARVVGPAVGISFSGFVALMCAQAKVVQRLAGNPVLTKLPSAWLKCVSVHRAEAGLPPTKSMLADESTGGDDDESDSDGYNGSGLFVGKKRLRSGQNTPGNPLKWKNCNEVKQPTLDTVRDLSAKDVRQAVGRQLVCLRPSLNLPVVPIGDGGLLQMVPVRAPLLRTHMCMLCSQFVAPCVQNHKIWFGVWRSSTDSDEKEDVAVKLIPTGGQEFTKLLKLGDMAALSVVPMLATGERPHFIVSCYDSTCGSRVSGCLPAGACRPASRRKVDGCGNAAPGIPVQYLEDAPERLPSIARRLFQVCLYRR